jgi:DNA-binding response OmpR family regulator
MPKPGATNTVERSSLIHNQSYFGKERYVIKILIVEDDPMIADATEELLVGSGYEVCGIARTVAAAVALGRAHKPDLAIIDVRLADGGIGTDIAIQLSGSERVGILYAAGNVACLRLANVAGDACLAKPYRAVDLLRSLELVTEIVAAGTATLPFPDGFRMLSRIASP